VLEGRELLSTFTVTNRHSAGAGSLRAAIIASNDQPGANTIDFDVAGTIRIGGKSLPAITNTVTIDGTSAPTFAGTPVVTVNFRGTKGLQFADGSAGSALLSLSLVKAGNAGVTLSAPAITVEGDYIGVMANGKTVAGNVGDGIRINSSSTGDVIGQSGTGPGVSYYNSAPAVDLPAGQSVSAWQGLRGSSTPGQYLMVGTVNGTTEVGQSLGTGILFDGTIDGKSGTSYAVNYPGAQYTSVFGPDNLGNGQVALVGNYRNLPDPLQQVQTNGFLFQGTTGQLNNPDNYTTIDYQPSLYNYDTLHSIMNGLIVGNASQVTGGTTPQTLSTVAFIYNTTTHAYTQIAYPIAPGENAQSNTAFGIWYNGGTSYTICGGYKQNSSNLPAPDANFPFGTAYMVDYNSATGAFSHWTSFNYPSTPAGSAPYLTHFEGISGVQAGTYTLNADWSSPDGSSQGASFVTVRRNADGTFSSGQWTPLDDTALPGTTSSNAVYGNAVVGIVYQGNSSLPYQATVNTVAQLGNVIAGNRGNGIRIFGAHTTVQGNTIGLLANGKTAAGNAGNGIRINASSSGNLIGQVNPVTGVTYYNADSVSLQPVSGWQGIRDSGTPGQYLITGTSNVNGLLYIGPISGSGGTSYAVNYPGMYSTSVYGPDVVAGNVLRMVGSYRATQGANVQGFVFQGTTADLSNPANYTTIDYPNATYVYVHSTMGDLAVGNADGPEGNAPLGTGHSFLYSVSQARILTDIVYPGATSTTSYGIWYNGGTSYTITGGYSMPGAAGKTIAAGYLVDYDSSTGLFTNWTSIAGPDGLVGAAVVTHFEGISSPEPGVYTLAATESDPTSNTPIQAAIATVRRNPDGTFGIPYWLNLNYPGATGLQTNDAVAGNQVVGIVNVSSGIIAYQATVNLGDQLSNVISANGGNGIGIYGSSDNRIAMNNIGTDSTGTRKKGNASNGILLTKGAARNFIGGTVSAGNDPTAGVIVRPPQGNLISGNRNDGVLIKQGSTQNVMSGNFVGTTASGNSALGNASDGVAIVHANANQLIGCTLQDQPFVYYNVLSGNGGNGLRITDSADTTVHADFMGVGANNATVVANRGNGLMVSGNSSNTQVGGVIPLGNVISGNRQNGIDLAGSASGFTSFNTFGGTYAFGGAAPNRRDGILVTATGGNNLIRTSIIGGNRGNGIEIGGHATGVQVTETAVGTNSDIQSAIPNGGDGILIDGHAHNNAIGGFQPSIEPQVTVSANDGYGIRVADYAHDNAIVHTYIGTNGQGTGDLGNTLGGIDIGSGTSSTTVGGAVAALQDEILYSGGPGVTIQSSQDNTVMGATIQGGDGYGVYVRGVVTGTQVVNNAISGNAGDGVTLVRARKVTIGGDSSGSGSQAVASPGNRIVTNQGYGLYARGGCNGSVVQGNTIAANGQGNVNLSDSRGITYIPKTGN
jgi:hypothetical protein